MTTFNMHEAKTQLSKLVDAAERGEAVVIARDGKPAVKLLPVEDSAATWSPKAMAFFASPANDELADFEIARDDLLDTERDLF